MSQRKPSHDPPGVGPFRRWLAFGLTPEGEAKYRRAYLGADLAQARFCALLILVPLVGFVFNDYWFFGLSRTFYGLLALRGAFLLLTAWFLGRLRHLKSYQAYDWAELLWALGLITLTVTVAATRPQAFVAHAIFAVVIILITLLVMPNRLGNQVTVAMAAAVGEVLAIGSGPGSRQATISLDLSLFVTLSIGLAGAWQLNSYRRREFRAREADREARREVKAEVSGRTEIESELRQSESKYHSLFVNMTEEVHFWRLVRDGQGRILTWRLVDANPPALRTWGKTLEEIQGRTTDEIFGPGATEHYRAVIEKIMREGAPHSFEDYFPHLGKHFRFTSVPFGDYFITTGADITDFKRIQETLQEEARRKDDFLALLGHELRNPLAPIGNAIFLLQHGGRDPDLTGRACAILKRQVEHMVHLVDELLDISRISRGMITLKQEPVDLGETVRAVLADYDAIIREHGLELDLDCPPGPVWIWADRARTVQALSNLLQNAVKFSRPGGWIRLSVGVEERLWGWVRVRDDGVGIPVGQLETIFEPFKQVRESIGRSPSGLGLGLALVKGLAQLHGGTVSAASAGSGQGAEFNLRLPLVQGAPLSAPAREASQEAPPVRSRRILVVEDLEDTARTTRLLLELMGHAVESALDGPSAVARAECFKPEIVLCDIGLPGDFDGYRVARALRAMAGMEAAYLVAATGFGSPEDKLKAEQAGFDTHLTKPVDPAVLERIIAGAPARNLV
jgi:signal transduction histidine kinase/CheY-like chemotaxis protein